jgi:hypothetical protein
MCRFFATSCVALLEGVGGVQPRNPWTTRGLPPETPKDFIHGLRLFSIFVHIIRVFSIGRHKIWPLVSTSILPLVNNSARYPHTANNAHLKFCYYL